MFTVLICLHNPVLNRLVTSKKHVPEFRLRESKADNGFSYISFRNWSSLFIRVYRSYGTYGADGWIDW